MLKITVPAIDSYDEVNEVFVTSDEVKLELEHSLVSLSKWESKWNLPFLSDKEKTTEQVLDYIECMSLHEIPDPTVVNRLDSDSVEKIQEYIAAKMTATWFSDTKQKKPNRQETITSELIYYWMVTLNIPFECQHWHLNRLITLIEVCNRKNDKPKKMGKQELANRNRSLNEARKAKLGTTG